LPRHFAVTVVRFVETSVSKNVTRRQKKTSRK